MNLFKVTSLLFILLFSGTAFAQQPQIACGKREVMVKQLTDSKYKESARVIGIIDETRILEIWNNAKTGSWTAFVTTNKGMSCMVAAGEALIILPDQKPKVPSIGH